MGSRWIAVLALLMLLTGCATWTPQRVFTDEAELLAKRGAPTRVWDNADGTRTLEYSTQPQGVSTWMYTVDATGRITEQFDALSPSMRHRVKKDMSVEEVERLLGQHRSVQRFALSGEEVWDWNVANEWPGILFTYFNVHFVGGKVVRTSYTYVYPRDGVFDSGMGWWGHPFGWPYYWDPVWGPWGPPGFRSHRWAWSHPWGWPYRYGW